LEAAEAIEQFIDELPDHSFSDRLLAGDRTKVSAVIERSVGQAFEGWKGQRDPKKSAEKLRAVWSRWAATGRDPFDKDTWATVPKITSYRDVKLAPDFEWTPDEYRHLDQLAKLLNADLESTSRAVKDFARLVLTHAEVPRTWIAALLCDHGIPAKSKKLDKPKVFIDYLLEMSWVYVQVQHFTRRCRRFGLAKLRSKFPSPGIKDSCGSPRQGNEATPSATTSRSFVAAPICPARTHQSPPNQFVLFAGRLIPPRIDFQFVFIRGGHNILSG
jgi:hypothetical protein